MNITILPPTFLLFSLLPCQISLISQAVWTLFSFALSFSISPSFSTTPFILLDLMVGLYTFFFFCKILQMSMESNGQQILPYIFYIYVHWIAIAIWTFLYCSPSICVLLLFTNAFKCVKERQLLLSQ